MVILAQAETVLQEGEVAMYNLGMVPDTTTIAANKQYTFIFSSWSSESSIMDRMGTLSAYATGITVKKDGMSKAIVNLVPLYAMPLSAWQNQFANIGLTDMVDAYVGFFMADPEFKFVNPATYWEPKIKSAGSWLGDTISGAFGYVKVLAIAGAVIVGGVVVLRYLPKPKYKENPKRHRKFQKR